MNLEAIFEDIIRRVIREEIQNLEMDDRLLTVEQAAEKLAFTNMDSVHRLKREGKLPAVYLGPGTLRFRNSDVQKLIRQGSSDLQDRAA
jgi:excisionase family DNA binding protein